MDVLEAIHQYRVENGLAPTLEELGQRFGVNRVTIYKHVQALIQKEVLENLTPGASRALDLTPSGQALLGGRLPFDSSPASDEDSDPETASNGSVAIPLAGRIAAGSPLEAVESNDTVTVDELLPYHPDLYLLEVQGDSMIEDHIQEGDLVMVRKDRQPRDGDVVVAILDTGEATLKRLYKESDGRFRLQPANSAMQPLFVQELEVRGVVTGVLRKM